MNKEAQRIAIAEWAGWKRAGYGWSNGNRSSRFLPDYLSDLNAMHKAEKGLTPEQWQIYEDLLVANVEFAWHAEAAQRAEAFLRTLSKWQESPTP